MKKLTIFLLTALLIKPVLAQIPVTDGASIAQDMLNQVETMAQWASQLQSMSDQYSQMQTDYQQMLTDYAAITGSRGLGTVMDDPSLRDYLPEDWQSTYDDVQHGGYGSLAGSAKTLYENNKVFDGCMHITASSERTSCEARAVKPYQDKGIADDTYSTAIKRINQIQGLMKQINKTQDPKAIQELQGRIALEQAMIQNEQVKLQLYKFASEAQEKIQQQQQKEYQDKVWSSRTGIKAKAPTF
jgi:type IV secretion system protein VirB5